MMDDFIRKAGALMVLVVLVAVIAFALATPVEADEPSLARQLAIQAINDSPSRAELLRSPALDRFIGESRPSPQYVPKVTPSLSISRVGRDHHLDENYTLFVNSKAANVICTVDGDYIVCR